MELNEETINAFAAIMRVLPLDTAVESTVRELTVVELADRWGIGVDDALCLIDQHGIFAEVDTCTPDLEPMDRVVVQEAAVKWWESRAANAMVLEGVRASYQQGAVAS